MLNRMETKLIRIRQRAKVVFFVSVVTSSAEAVAHLRAV